MSHPQRKPARLGRAMAIAALLMAAALTGLTPDPAEAKRLGGGSSIGMQRNLTPPSRPTQALPPAPAPAPQQAAPQRAPTTSPSAAQQPSANPTGSRSWLGPLAGIAAGLGLAWLFSSLGLSETVGSLLLLLAGGALLFWLARRVLGRSAPLQPVGATASGVGSNALLNRVGAPAGVHAGASTAAPPTGASTATATSLRSQIDEAAFLTEAKRRFIALQAAHDRQDWHEIAAFVTPELYQALRERADAHWQPGQRTDIVSLDAKLVDVVEEEGQYVATIQFGGLIREREGTPPHPFTEYWHLVKPVTGTSGWRLAGIELT